MSIETGKFFATVEGTETEIHMKTGAAAVQMPDGEGSLLDKLEASDAKVAALEKLVEDITSLGGGTGGEVIEAHTTESVNSEVGVHGFRFYNNMLQFMNPNGEWVEIEISVKQPPRTMTAKIDLTNSNPETAVTYHDDAEDMVPGSASWDKFFGHRPCLFKNGEVIGYLNPNNFNQFEDGSDADISGDAGDVMIEFPRRGLTINTVGNIVTIKMTDDPGHADFEYNAHTRGTSRRENFYLGAYKGSNISSKLRSLPNMIIQASQTLGTFRTQAQNNGDGYELSGFYQLTFRQVMFILKYKTLDSQSAVGRGYVNNHSGAIATGGTETWGMDCELIKATDPGCMTDGAHHVKCFGLEDFWGNVYERIDGIVTDSTRNILVGNDNFNDAGSGYENQGQGAAFDIHGCISKPQGTTKTGFLLKEGEGSTTTYFCDLGYFWGGCGASFGGTWTVNSSAGAFTLLVDGRVTSSGGSTAARLMYL